MALRSLIGQRGVPETSSSTSTSWALLWHPATYRSYQWTAHTVPHHMTSPFSTSSSELPSTCVSRSQDGYQVEEVVPRLATPPVHGHYPGYHRASNMNNLTLTPPNTDKGSTTRSAPHTSKAPPHPDPLSLIILRMASVDSEMSKMLANYPSPTNKAPTTPRQQNYHSSPCSRPHSTVFMMRESS